MWTYLIIFLSIGLVFGVFIRRALLVNKAANTPEEQKNIEADEDLSIDKKKRISKTDKEVIAELCEKAEIKLKVGNEDEAIKLLVQALAINELHEEAQHKLAMLYMQKQMYSAAAALFKRLGSTTNDPVHYSHLGLALYQQKEFEEAKRAYQKAVDLDDSRPQRFASLSSVYRSLGELQISIIALNKAIEIDKENITYLLLLADIQVEMEDYGNALKTLNGILDLDPENEEAKEYFKKVQAMQSA